MQPAPHTTPPTGRDMLWETFELLGGFGAMLMPLVALGVPGIVLFGLPYLLLRAIRRPSAA